MEAVQPVSVEEYLNTSYEHDPELINGQLKERPMPTRLHGFVQAMVTHWFALHMAEWGVMVLPEVRTRVSASNFRLPDIAVVRLEPPRGKTQDQPPLIAIEILSPDDKFSDLRGRAADLTRMGVEHVWLIDPETQETFTWGGPKENGWRSVSRFVVSGSPLYLDLDWLWGQIPQE